MHCAQHASDEFVYAIALLHQGHQSSDPTFVVDAASEVRKDEFLESIDLILKCHQVGNSLVALVRVVD
jgi:hypothetical protein